MASNFAGSRTPAKISNLLVPCRDTKLLKVALPTYPLAPKTKTLGLVVLAGVEDPQPMLRMNELRRMLEYIYVNLSFFRQPTREAESKGDQSCLVISLFSSFISVPGCTQGDRGVNKKRQRHN